MQILKKPLRGLCNLYLSLALLNSLSEAAQGNFLRNLPTLTLVPNENVVSDEKSFRKSIFLHLMCCSLSFVSGSHNLASWFLTSLFSGKGNQPVAAHGGAWVVTAQISNCN